MNYCVQGWRLLIPVVNVTKEDCFVVFIVVNKYTLFYLLSVVQLLQTLSDGLQQPWAGTNHKLGI